jgi:serine/threonine protein kinase
LSINFFFPIPQGQSMSSPFVDLDGIPIPGNEVLGYGRTGIVVRRQDTAVKMPIRYSDSTDDDVASNAEVIKREQDVYRRLGQCEGVVPCINFSETSIQLAFMENGDLRTYLTKTRPSKPLQLSWFREMARALARIHDHGIIVADIASRNFLVAGDLSIKFCDFTESSIMPPSTNMETVDDSGYSIQTDTGQLGAVIYEVVTGARCEFDLFKDLPLDASDATWPQNA